MRSNQQILKETCIDLINDIKTHILKDPYDKIEAGAVLNWVTWHSDDDFFVKVKKSIVPFSKQIKNKEEIFFLDDNNKIFDRLEKSNYFKKMWQKQATNEDKDVIWRYFLKIVSLIE